MILKGSVWMKEVEKRTFISKEKYEELARFFKEKADHYNSKKQIITQYRTDTDFRIVEEKNGIFFRLYANHLDREKLIITLDKKERDSIMKMFRALGMTIDVKWYRRRIEFSYQDYQVTLDKTFRYGFVISVSKLVQEEDIAEEMRQLDSLFEQFRIPMTSPEQFNSQYHYYNLNWYDFTQHIDDTHFFDDEQ